MASWLGQIVGNRYGLSYEFQFLDAPGLDAFPYGYGPTLERVPALGEAFSDDDTDIEYLALLQMEQHGYAWAHPVTIARLGLYVGFPREAWGWLKAPAVEVRTEAGAWVPDLTITPPFPADVAKYLQPGLVGYDFRFAPVTTRAIRLVGTVGGHPVDGPPTYGSAVSELTVHAE